MIPQGATGEAPSRAYEQGVARGDWQFDPAQRAVCDVLDRIQRRLLRRADENAVVSIIARLRKRPAVKGLYLHGGVGRGKTFLIDLLHDSLPEALSRRMHFHRFMGRVHQELAKLKQVQDPLRIVAQDFARTPLLCLDEFFVQDIGDAMILSELLKHLVAAGGTLVTTSNIPPAGLYKDGLQRQKFLPAIALIQRHCEVMELDTPTDYRLRALTSAPTYLQPADAAAEAALTAMFERLAPGSLRPEREMVVNDRPIPIKRRADGIAWFEFEALCEGPRAVADYIELAKSYNTIVLSNVPAFDARNDDAGRRFVHLVDELYDRNVNLIVSAAAPPGALYSGERLVREFERAGSRLIEMQSTEYLAQPHKP